MALALMWIILGGKECDNFLSEGAGFFSLIISVTQSAYSSDSGRSSHIESVSL